ncbi:hypothetical protein GIY56_11585 [Paracoccus sp. YIM 132242]|uniref:Uncharacterized protein n=1 Tax=Paracoccus lichenicola TaxID=2665644 RepID=A0A6L6HP79_9RHOB|nr:hypothetical protein [Paracoccus lichenicola]MTE00936.1 hypothetical protein [Paracoccus lichenicola]
MTLDYANEYPDVLSRQSERDHPSSRARFRGAASTERDGKSVFGLGRASSADPVNDRRTDEAVACLCEDLPV